MTAEERFALETMTRAWLRGISVARIKRHGAECPTPTWDEIPQPDRVILMAGVAAAMKAGLPENLAAARRRRDEAALAASLEP